MPLGIDNGLALVVFFVAGYLIRQQIKGKFNSILCGLILFVCGEAMAQLIGIQSFASRIHSKMPVCFMASIIATVGLFVLVKCGYKITGVRIVKKVMHL